MLRYFCRTVALITFIFTVLKIKSFHDILNGFVIEDKTKIDHYITSRVTSKTKSKKKNANFAASKSIHCETINQTNHNETAKSIVNNKIRDFTLHIYSL